MSKKNVREEKEEVGGGASKQTLTEMLVTDGSHAENSNNRPCHDCQWCRVMEKTHLNT